MWRWLDRERRLHEEKVLRKTAADSSRMWFRHYQRSVSEKRSLAEQLAGARRYRLAWLSARERAKRIHRAGAREMDKLRAQMAVLRSDHFAQVKALQDERTRWERAAEQRIVPAVSVPLNPDDRSGLYRLEDENARLRDRVAELEAKYEGNPS